MDCVRTLMVAGADTEVQYRHGEWPVWLVARWGCTQTLHAVIEAGADINIGAADSSMARQEAWGMPKIFAQRQYGLHQVAVMWIVSTC